MLNTNMFPILHIPCLFTEIRLYFILSSSLIREAATFATKKPWMWQIRAFCNRTRKLTDSDS